VHTYRHMQSHIHMGHVSIWAIPAYNKSVNKCYIRKAPAVSTYVYVYIYTHVCIYIYIYTHIDLPLKRECR